MRRGEQRGKAHRRYRQFRERVLQAEVTARVRAEVAMHAARPDTWLKSGPGKERRDRPGWTMSAKPVYQSATQINILDNPQASAVLGVILSALAAHPDAKASVLAELQRLQQKDALIPIELR